MSSIRLPLLPKGVPVVGPTMQAHDFSGERVNGFPECPCPATLFPKYPCPSPASSSSSNTTHSFVTTVRDLAPPPLPPLSSSSTSIPFPSPLPPPALAPALTTTMAFSGDGAPSTTSLSRSLMSSSGMVSTAGKSVALRTPRDRHRSK
uniref:Uncharacterized protein n=1 Tax=Ananas comosus var. bracteatus TaxID=296719 RepID=A0A6V7P5S6_ANACO|nr:unnamed protein product [Ananas comosus var. bracteatus]